MLKLRRDLNRACTILDMVKRREQSKKDHLQLTVEVFEKRYGSVFLNQVQPKNSCDCFSYVLYHHSNENFEHSRYTAGDYAGQILQQCMDMIRYQPPATNLTVPTSAGYGDNVTPGAGTGGEREHELWRRGLQVMLLTTKLYLWWMTMYVFSEHLLN